MKRLFSKSNKSKPRPTSTPITPVTATTLTIPHTTGLQPKYIVPPIPHPYPYDHLAIIASKDGLLLRPHIPQSKQSKAGIPSHLRISWDKSARCDEVEGDGEVDWDDDAVIVYGIVGMLELFSASYLLVITGRDDVGNLFDPLRIVYCVKGITAIPLIEDKARASLHTLAARHAALSRPSLLPSTTMDTISSESDIFPEESVTTPTATSIPIRSPPKVQFVTPNKEAAGEGDAISLNTDADEHAFTRAPSDSSADVSGTCTPTSDITSPSSPVAKAIAARLSFWSRISKRSSLFPPERKDEVVEVEAEEEVPLKVDAMMNEEVEVDEQQEPHEVLESILSNTAPAPESHEEKQTELEGKIVRECIREFVKGGMFFAYNFDLTRSLQHKQEQVKKARKQDELLVDLNALPAASSEKVPEGDQVDPLVEPNPTLPLWRRVDRHFWWNEWLSKPLIDAGLHSYILPIMQGYFQTASFPVPPEELNHDSELAVDYILISRRSRDRAGLRYQRRGVDDDAHVANFVETETIMRIKREGITNIFSYVQIRGSIPLFWHQAGYGLKPPPLLSTERTHQQHLEAMTRHFRRTIPQYGPHTIVNLAEQHGKEGAITQAYHDYVKEQDDKDFQYHGYDFHTETRGMKYENISKLIDAMEKTFDHQGYLWISNGTPMSEQRGVFRVNCIDCLDRTNVVQSAFARYVLNKQLGAVALLNQSEGRTEMDTMFNDVWANNGDAISRAYAGTSALKGDFTRTGKRDLSGLLNDGVNSLARMYTATFSDWFCQAVIDFMLGNRTLSVFSEFLLKLQSTDPSDLIRLSKIRAEAIATSVQRCLSEGERLLAGWTLFAPEELNTKVGEKFEEKVLLLSASAIYIVSYDYTLEKVKMYTRVPLGDIVGITKGAYILSPLEEPSRDPQQNAGFVINWLNKDQVTRVTSYSIRNSLESPPSPKTPTMPTTQKPFPSGNSIADASHPAPSTAAAAAASSVSKRPDLPPSRSRLSVTFSRKSSASLSNILTNVQVNTSSDKTFQAFKMLPIDPARVRRVSSTGTGTAEYADMTEELAGASSCKEAVDMVVDAICNACREVGSMGKKKEFVTEEDVVSLVEAQRMTSMYAKMEYGVKRLLWLGG